MCGEHLFSLSFTGLSLLGHWYKYILSKLRNVRKHPVWIWMCFGPKISYATVAIFLSPMSHKSMDTIHTNQFLVRTSIEKEEEEVNLNSWKEYRLYFN